MYGSLHLEFEEAEAGLKSKVSAKLEHVSSDDKIALLHAVCDVVELDTRQAAILLVLASHITECQRLTPEEFEEVK